MNVELPVETAKKSFALKQPTLKMLTEYAAFLSDHHGATIDEDRVVEGAIQGLARDRAFAAWKRAAHA